MDKGSDDIYENVMIHELEKNRTRPAHSGAGDKRKRSCRGAAVFLGLLCLLLLAGLLVFLYTKENSEWKMEMVLLQNSYNNMTGERNDIQTRYNNLTKEQQQLQKRFEDVIKERNDLQKKFSDHKQWLLVNESVYYISSQMKSWQESRNYCLHRDADLVIINSKEEQDLIRQFKKRVWIGLTDNEIEKTWKWVDGSPLTTRYWNSGEPNGEENRDEDCVEIKHYEMENSWNDESCNLQNLWVCEKRVAL